LSLASIVPPARNDRLGISVWNKLAARDLGYRCLNPSRRVRQHIVHQATCS